MERPIYRRNPLSSYPSFRLGRKQYDQVTGLPSYERYNVLQYGYVVNARDRGSWDQDYQYGERERQTIG